MIAYLITQEAASFSAVLGLAITAWLLFTKTGFNLLIVWTLGAYIFVPLYIIFNVLF